MPKRVAWTTSGVKGQPEPPLPYKVKLAFPNLKFKSPITLTLAPGMDRLFMVENGGKLYSFPNNRNVRKRDLFFDLAAIKPNLSQTYGLAFHPNFQENRYVFLNYILKGTDPDGSKVSRFKVLDTNPPRIDPKTPLISFVTSSTRITRGTTAAAHLLRRSSTPPETTRIVANRGFHACSRCLLRRLAPTASSLRLCT